MQLNIRFKIFCIKNNCNTFFGSDWQGDYRFQDWPRAVIIKPSYGGRILQASTNCQISGWFTSRTSYPAKEKCIYCYAIYIAAFQISKHRLPFKSISWTKLLQQWRDCEAKKISISVRLLDDTEIQRPFNNYSMCLENFWATVNVLWKKYSLTNNLTAVFQHQPNLCCDNTQKVLSL